MNLINNWGPLVQLPHRVIFILQSQTCTVTHTHNSHLSAFRLGVLGTSGRLPPAVRRYPTASDEHAAGNGALATAHLPHRVRSPVLYMRPGLKGFAMNFSAVWPGWFRYPRHTPQSAKCSSPGTMMGVGCRKASRMYTLVFSMGRPMGTICGAGAAGHVQYVMSASVGPYTLCSLACERVAWKLAHTCSGRREGETGRKSGQRASAQFCPYRPERTHLPHAQATAVAIGVGNWPGFAIHSPQIRENEVRNARLGARFARCAARFGVPSSKGKKQFLTLGWFLWFDALGVLGVPPC